MWSLFERCSSMTNNWQCQSNEIVKKQKKAKMFYVPLWQDWARRNNLEKRPIMEIKTIEVMLYEVSNNTNTWIENYISSVFSHKCLNLHFLPDKSFGIFLRDTRCIIFKSFKFGETNMVAISQATKQLRNQNIST